MKSNKEIHITRRISLGWHAFGRISSFFNQNVIEVYNQCILPIISYEAEAWILIKIFTFKLRTAQREHGQTFLDINWKHKKKQQHRS